MNKYEYMKNINIEQMGHFLCDAMEDSEDENEAFEWLMNEHCSNCPLNRL